MGLYQTEQPLLGEEGIGPAHEVAPLRIAPTFAPFLDDHAQPLAYESVQSREHEPMAVLEVRKPAPQAAVHFRDDALERLSRFAFRLLPDRFLDFQQALLTDRMTGAVEVIPQKVKGRPLAGLPF